jgi:hypothetical protein
MSMEVFTDGDIQLRQWQLSTLPRVTHILDWYRSPLWIGLHCGWRPHEPPHRDSATHWPMLLVGFFERA